MGIVFKFPGQRAAVAALLSPVVLLGGLCAGVTSPAWGDTLNLAGGQVVTGKVQRVTGELITVQKSFGSSDVLYRIRLTDRQDTVRLRNGEQYTGEIIYMDKFRVELRSEHGMEKIWRMLVKEIELGTSLQGDNSVVRDDVPAAPAVAPATQIKPVSFSRTTDAKTPNPDKPVVHYPAKTE